MKRLFLGAAIGGEAHASLVVVLDRLRAVAERQGVRFVRPEKLHLTLIFLDAQPEERIEEFDRLGREACRRHSPFSLSLQGLGGFPHLRRPKVLWCGVGGDVSALTSLNEDLESAFAGFGKGKTGVFQPHVTLARINPGSPKVGHDVSPLAAELEDRVIGDWEMRDVRLFESSPDGHYETLRVWPLGSAIAS